MGHGTKTESWKTLKCSIKKLMGTELIIPHGFITVSITAGHVTHHSSIEIIISVALAQIKTEIWVGITNMNSIMCVFLYNASEWPHENFDVTNMKTIITWISILTELLVHVNIVNADCWFRGCLLFLKRCQFAVISPTSCYMLLSYKPITRVAP